MKRTFFRAFGIACFLIGMSLFLIDRYNLPIHINASENSTKHQNEIDQLKKQLDEANKQIKEYQAQLKNHPKTSKTEKNTNHSNGEGKKDVVKGTLYIYPGLSLFDIAKKLKEMGIIDNSVEMELYLAQPEYSRNIQIGKYELDSTMSVEDIANIITGKNENKDKNESKKK